jgi:AraC-like DNA-binding protein
LIQMRVFRAKQLLAAGVPIAQAAFDTGFTDQSHLNRHFKRLVGITPGQYALGCH